jgi:hypothetical protein
LRSLYGTTNVSHGTTRGGARHPLYAVWVGMKDRCCNPNCGGYKNYGGRGIVVCERWRNDFAAFIADMGPRTHNERARFFGFASRDLPSSMTS